jgi:hypothetical protein
MVRAGDDDSFADVGVADQRGLDVSGFDTDAADLDLVVAAADELERAVEAPAGDVSGAVQTGVGVDGERVIDELRGGQLGQAEIAAGEVGPADAQLAGGADRYGAQVDVQDVQVHVVERHADRDDAADGAGAAAQRGREEALGRAPAVDEGRDDRGDVVLQRRRQAAGGRDDVPQGGAFAESGCERGGQQRGDRDPFDNCVAAQEVDERGAVDRAVGRDEDKARAGCQRVEDLRDRQAEAERRGLQLAVTDREREVALLPRGPVGDPAVALHDPLGPAGRARSVEHDGGIIEGRRDDKECKWGRRDRGAVVVEVQERRVRCG